MDIDLAEGRVSFLSQDRPGVSIDCDAGLVCSVAERPPSLLWGWANENVPPSRSLDVGARLRDFGERHGGQLACPEIPRDRIAVPADAQVDPAVFVTTLACAAAVSVAGPGVPWVAEASPGTLMGLYLRPRGVEVPVPTGPQIQRALLGPLELGLVADHRQLFQGLAESLADRGATVEWDRTGDGAELRMPGSVHRATFDRRGRLSHLGGTLGPS